MRKPRTTLHPFATTTFTLLALVLATPSFTGADEGCFIIRGRQLAAHPGSTMVSGRMTAIAQHGSFDTRPMLRVVLFGPTGAVEAGHWSPTRNLEDIVLDVNTAFVTADHGLFSLDLSDPFQPRMLDFVHLTDAQHITLDGDIVYVATTGDAGNGWFDVVDITDPSAMEQQGRITWSGSDPEKNAMDAAGSTVVIADNAGLLVLDVSDSYNPVEVGRWNADPVHDTALVGSLAVVTLAEDTHPDDPGITVLDLSNPANPTVVGRWHSSSTVLSVAEYGGDVAVGTESHGLYTIDLGDPAQPTVIDHWDELGLDVNHISTAWPTLALSSEHFGLTVLGLAPECIAPRSPLGRSGR